MRTRDLERKMRKVTGRIEKHLQDVLDHNYPRGLIFKDKEGLTVHDHYQTHTGNTIIVFKAVKQDKRGREYPILVKYSVMADSIRGVKFGHNDTKRRFH